MKYYYPDDDEQKEVTVQNVPLIVLELILLIISLFSFVAPIMISLFKMENLNVLLVMWVLILLLIPMKKDSKNESIEYIILSIRYLLIILLIFTVLYYFYRIIAYAKFGFGIIISTITLMLAICIVPYTSKTVKVDDEDEE